MLTGKEKLNRFFAWISARVSSSERASLYATYKEIDSYFINHGFLDKSILETLDIQAIEKIQAFLYSPKVYFFTLKKSRILNTRQAVNYYHDFLKNYAGTNSTEDAENDEDHCGNSKTSVSNDCVDMKSEEEEAPTVGKVIEPSASIFEHPDSSSTDDVTNEDTEDIPPAVSNKPPISTSAGVESTKVYVYDYEANTPLVYTIPDSIIYFGHEYGPFSSWRELYISSVKLLYTDFPKEIEKYTNRCITGRSSLDFADARTKYRLMSAYQLSGNFYVAAISSAVLIAKKIKALLDICCVDYDELVIRFRKKDEISDPQSDSSIHELKDGNVKSPANKTEENCNDDYKQTSSDKSAEEDAPDIDALEPEEKSYDFSSDESLKDTFPTELLYFGESYTGFKSWAELYIQALNCLYDDYAPEFKKLINGSILTYGSCDFADWHFRETMRLPEELVPGFFVETRRTPNEMVERLRKLLNICRVDYENLEIWYKSISEGNREDTTDAGLNTEVYEGEDISPAEPSESPESKAKYSLHALHKTYDDNTPAEAFLAFCEELNSRYPKEFSNLIGRRPRSMEFAALRKYAPDEKFLKMESTGAFIDPQLADAEVVKIAEWLCEQCGDTSGDISITKNVAPVNVSAPSCPEQESATAPACDERRNEAPTSVVGATDTLPSPAGNENASTLASKNELPSNEGDESTADSEQSSNRLQYISWLQAKGMRYGTILTFVYSLGQCTKLANEHGIYGGDVLAIEDVSELTRVADVVLALPEMSDQGEAKLDCAKKAIRFLTECRKVVRPAQPYISAARDDPSSDVHRTDNNPAELTAKMDSAGSTEVEGLLKADRYEPLRTALVKQGIATIEQLKAVKLWPFMNGHNLYSIATRQKILEEVTQLLNPPKAINEALLYKLSKNGVVYKGQTPSEAFLHFCEDTVKYYPLQFRRLIGLRAADGRVVVMRNSKSKDDLRMTMPVAFISPDLTLEDTALYAYWISTRCGEKVPDIQIDAPDPSSTLNPAVQSRVAESLSVHSQSKGEDQGCPSINNFDDITEEERRPDTSSINDASSENSPLIQKVEQLILSADLDGLKLHQIADQLDLTMSMARQTVSAAPHIVDIKGRLIHEDAFVDWNVGANAVKDILDKLMAKNDGYVSAAQLYEYARTDMNMFLNDNDMDNPAAVYDIAKHLFEKRGFSGIHYVFTNDTHISRPEDTVTSNLDVARKYAADQGGFFTIRDLEAYLRSVGLKTGNLRAQLKLYDEPIFLFYDDGMLVSSERLNITDEWLRIVKEALTALFEDSGDHMILRAIPDIWYDRLPPLPESKPWTPLLLQNIVKFYGEILNARTILAMEYQSLDTVHSMIVRADSPIESFADVVATYIVENEIPQRQFEAEELRGILVSAKMIRGNELIYNMPKALRHDERFAWDAAGEHVLVKV